MICCPHLIVLLLLQLFSAAAVSGDEGASGWESAELSSSRDAGRSFKRWSPPAATPFARVQNRSLHKSLKEKSSQELISIGRSEGPLGSSTEGDSSVFAQGGDVGLRQVDPAPSKTGEWVQIILQSEENDLNAEIVGKVVPASPVTMSGHHLQGLPNNIKEVKESSMESSLQVAGLSPPAETPMEVPSRVKLVIQVETLKLDSPVVYTFRWGKPATWADHDYKLEVTEAGVYSLELREPLMFSQRPTRQVRQQAGSPSSDEQDTSVVQFRWGMQRLQDYSRSPHAWGFKRLEGAAGCKLASISEDGPQARTVEMGSRLMEAPQRGSEVHSKVRMSHFPLFYSIQRGPYPGGRRNVSPSEKRLRHSLCLVFYGTPMRQLLPFHDAPGLTADFFFVGATGKVRKLAGTGAGLNAQANDFLKGPAVISFPRAKSSADAKIFEGPPPGERVEALHKPVENQSLERLSKKRRPMCIIVSQLPTLEGVVQSHNLKDSKNSSLGPGGAQKQDFGAVGETLLLRKKNFRNGEIWGLHSLKTANTADCEAPYLDYVFFTEPLRFTARKHFKAEAEDGCGSTLSLIANALEGPWSVETAANKGKSCLQDATATRQGGRLWEAPSVTFLWRQAVFLNQSKDFASSPLELPAAIWELLQSGQVPCVLLSFRGWGGPKESTLSDPTWLANLELGSESVLNSCKLFAEALQQGSITEESLIQAEGVLWTIPRNSVPTTLSVAAGSLVYHIRLVAALADGDLPEYGGPHSLERHREGEEQADRHGNQQGEKQQSAAWGGKLWLLEQGLEVREPQYGEWRLRLRRRTLGNTATLESTGALTENSAADALTLFAVRRTCRSIVEASKRRAQFSRPRAPCLGKDVNDKTQPERAKLPQLNGLYAAASSDGSTVAKASHKLLESEWNPPGRLLEDAAAHVQTLEALKGQNAQAGELSQAGSNEEEMYCFPDNQQLEGTKEDCRWCSKTFATFVSASAFKPYALQLELIVGAAPASFVSSSQAFQEARRLSALLQERTPSINVPSVNTPDVGGASLRWRQVGPAVFSSLTLTPATASGGRHLSVFLNLLPFAASRKRRCSHLRLNGTDGDGKKMAPKRLYFYALHLQISRDAVPPAHQQSSSLVINLRTHDTPAEAPGAPKGNQEAAGKSRVPSNFGSSLRTATVHLPVFCEDPAPFEEAGLSESLSSAAAEASSLGGGSWTLTAEMIPPQWDWYPTTYVLKWRLLEAERNELDPQETGSLPSDKENENEDSSAQISAADVWVRLVAFSDFSAFCSQQCPPTSSCSITERLAGFAIFGCRCAYGLTGSSCEYEAISVWLRLLARGFLVLSNLALLPAVFLCMRLCVRHLPCLKTSEMCSVCFPRCQAHTSQENLISILWSRHSCFLLHTVRALIYFNALFWSLLYHACVDASARLPLEAPVLQRLSFVFSHFALLVTTFVLADIGSNAVELLALTVMFALLGCIWFPHTLEKQTSLLFVAACIALPLISLWLKASTLRRRSRRALDKEAPQQQKAHCEEWRPEDVKWLDGGNPSDTETDSPGPAEVVHARHEELQRLLRQRLEETREAACLSAISQAIARLEAAHKCPVALCFASNPSLSMWQCRPTRLESARKMRAAGIGPSEDDSTASSYYSKRPVSHLQTSLCGQSKRPLNLKACAEIALTQVVPRLEFLVLGLMLAAFGLTCKNVGMKSDLHWLTHSLGHILIQAASCFILLSRLHHPGLTELGQSDHSFVLHERRQLAGRTRALPSRSLSESLSLVDAPATLSGHVCGGQSRLASAFCRALHRMQQPKEPAHSQADDFSPENEDQAECQHQNHELLSADNGASVLWSDTASLAFVGNPSHCDMQHLLPSLVRLLLQQYSVHKRLHARRATIPDEEQQPSCAASPTNGEAGLVRLGAAASVSPLSALRHPSTTNSSGCTAEFACTSLWTAGDARYCLWCIVKGALDDVTLVRINHQRMHWACRLRFFSIFNCNCSLLPRWVSQRLEGIIERGRERREWIQQQPEGSSIYFCS
ncbi:hypothetical protein Efla_001274 [Eimeria flavescens]